MLDLLSFTASTIIVAVFWMNGQIDHRRCIDETSRPPCNSTSIHNPKTLLRLEDLNFSEARANPNEP